MKQRLRRKKRERFRKPGVDHAGASRPLTSDASRGAFRDLFEGVYVINLARRADRWEAFRRRLPGDWPFRQPIRLNSVDGQLVPAPSWWRGGAGAWGCYRSHLAILEECLNHNVTSVLIMEDDAAFVDGFSEKASQFIANLPDDWGLIYLGGQHLQQDVRLPRKINDWVYLPFNVNRTHCFALRGRAMIELVYRHLNEIPSWSADHHIDHHLGELHKLLDRGLYAPKEWLAVQEGGRSNINGQEWPQSAFAGAEELTSPQIDLRMIAVVGPFRSGTSCTAGVLHALGINLGTQFCAPNAANPKGCFEAEGLAKFCRMAYLEPWMTEQMHPPDRVNLLRHWAGNRCRHLREQATFAAGKHPALCCLGEDLLEAWNDPLFVVVDRPLAESIDSLLRANWDWPEAAVRHALPLLRQTRDAFLKKHAPRHLRVSFHRLLQRPEEAVENLCRFLSYEPTEAQRQAAVRFVGLKT